MKKLGVVLLMVTLSASVPLGAEAGNKGKRDGCQVVSIATTIIWKRSPPNPGTWAQGKNVIATTTLCGDAYSTKIDSETDWTYYGGTSVDCPGPRLRLC